MKHLKALRNGVVGAAAVALLAAGTTTAQADPGNPTVGYGYPNYARQVACVQFFVNWYTGMRIAVDGKFGPQTGAGVKRLQEISNRTWATQELDVDGVFGPRTGQVVLTHAKNDRGMDQIRAASCSHAVPSYSVVY
ncbi:peptidoglycan-binding domain-containing protein [Streptomyces echinatus]|uniref:Peptidoglycan hydrolase-like protein with peptidoglycan-binding domain n=1 Tax=Streptomyces echinatus TaxID=67293 RepID=A0A7W9Q1X3_9ACTN|nr:hypothetical protein [Streptomyces echinatus]MBB5932075.1 peptidoglycan hydrolase-like protein with peptidoglycan-binding domain [Streptomyces echinatus]